MTPATADPVAVQNGKPTKKTPVPPDEKFWKRYSPHHEAPVSGVTSLTIHILIPCLIAIYFFVFGKYLQDKSKPIPLGVVAIGNPNSGGGGNPGGVEGGLDTKEVVTPEDQIKNDIKPDVPTPLPIEPLMPQPRETITLPKDDVDNPRITEQAMDAAKSLDGIKQRVIDRLRPGNPGKGGKGSGGGDGPGKGTGVGTGTEPGVQGFGSDREKRILRWTLRFSTRDGRDYAQQLAGLGAILAIPLADGNFQVIRDLKRLPAKGEVEDINSINRIFWVDNQPESVRSLSTALRLAPMPPYIVAFFPESLEKRLLEKERTSSGGKAETQIKETRFVVERQPNGSYDARVTHQVMQ